MTIAKRNNNELTLTQKEYTRRIIADPVLFAQHILGVTVWQGQIDLLRAIQKFRRTAIKSCHGVGKTFALAIVILWWIARYREGVAFTTSPTQRQVRTQIWAEIHRLIAQAKVPYPELNTTALKFRDDNNFAMGFSTNQAEKFQGYHGKRVLIVIDEANGVEPGIFDAISGTMAGGEVHVVMSGNPTSPSGPFYDAFTKERALWNCLTIDVFDSPNLIGLSLEELVKLDAGEGGPLDQNPFPHFATKRWVFEQRHAWWQGDEPSSPNWMARVRAQFPGQGPNALFKLSWLECARRASQAAADGGQTPLVAGVDVGGGGEAETVAYVCEAKPNQCRIVAMGAWRGEDTRGEVVRFLNKYRTRLSAVRVDAIGVGHNFALHLRDQRFYVEMVNVGSACGNRQELGENNPAQRFANQKAFFYQTLADMFERDQIEGLIDEATIGQLAGVLFEIDSRGRLMIESKERGSGPWCAIA